MKLKANLMFLSTQPKMNDVIAKEKQSGLELKREKKQ